MVTQGILPRFLSPSNVPVYSGKKRSADAEPQASPAEKEACHFCQTRSFATHAAYPITIVNETDDGSVLNPNFRFIDRSVLGRGVEVAEESFRTGCECPDDEDCMYGRCLCLEEMATSSDDDDDDDDDNYEDDEAMRDGPRKKRFAYYSHGTNAGLLRSRILHSREPIYECHAGCRCSLACPNRVVERGRKVPLQVFRTSDRGWGIRCPIALRKGQFVDKYLGEIITNQEADRRRDESDIANRKDVYLFALDKFSDPDSLDPRLAAAALEVDGEYMSGPTRFANHSCEPNMRIFARVGDHADKHVHDLALFAIQDIPAGEELTFDYVDGAVDLDSDAHDPDKMKDMTRCLCGTERCRGFLW